MNRIKAKRSRASKPRGVVLHLVQKKISRETVDHFLFLAREASAGRVIGSASTVIHPGSHFSCYITGEAKRNHTFTRGAVASIADVLGKVMNLEGS